MNLEKTYYNDERYCGHCKKTTNHKCKDSNHERDSSGDFQECLECHWWMSGITRDYIEPLDFR